MSAEYKFLENLLLNSKEYEWKPIQNFEDYFINSAGMVCSIKKKGRHFAYYLSLIKPKTGQKYYYVDLYKNGVYKRKYIHHLVLEHFVSNRPNDQEALHGSLGKHNNTVKNLRWGTKKENMADKLLSGTDNRGSKHGNSKLKEPNIVSIRELSKSGFNNTEIAKNFNVSQSAISRIVRNKSWFYNNEPMAQGDQNANSTSDTEVRDKF